HRSGGGRRRWCRVRAVFHGAVLAVLAGTPVLRAAGPDRQGRRGAQAADGLNSTRISLMPLMKFERRRRGGAASCMSGMRLVISLNITLISARARLAPRQK